LAASNRDILRRFRHVVKLLADANE
jgi:hypothetical protein